MRHRTALFFALTFASSWGLWFASGLASSGNRYPVLFPAGDTYRQSFPLYLLQVTAISITMAWLFVKTDGSLLLTMLFHAAVNNFKDIVPSADPDALGPLSLSHSHVAWITVALLWVGAALALVGLRRLPAATPA